MDLKDILNEKNCSIVASNGYVSFDSGIRPVIERLNEDIYYFKGLSVADKIIGKASAMLLCLSGVKEVYAAVLSRSGKEIFDKYGVVYEYGELADYIINRKGDGMCPMEMTVKDIDDLKEAYEALNRKIALH
ncbi:MAG: DUF1893 domain-containing protein [Erysipelotrichaceae bacterium]|nr:DUF1893 domain-containing protein [Erysipelotrichaceae bacterium]